MLRYAVLFALVSCAFASALPEDLDGRIFNGEYATIEAYPYQVSIQIFNGDHICGGSIVDEDTVITAAHCMQKDTEFKVRLGTTFSNVGGEIIAVKSFHNHPGFNSETMQNDISIIKLATAVMESDKVRYIKLAETSPPTGTRAVVTGWSKCTILCFLPNHLKKVEVSIIDRDVCIGDKYKNGPFEITDSMVCAAPDSCLGDSGGPLISESGLGGVVSRGTGCARAAFPSVYTDVASLRPWLDDTMASLKLSYEK